MVRALPSKASAGFVAYRSRIIFPEFPLHEFIVPEDSMNRNTKNTQKYLPEK
jgi:hypothetical protein